MCICSLRYAACNAHPPYCHLWPEWHYTTLVHYFINSKIFRGKKLLNIKCVFWFSLQLLSVTFLTLGTEWDVIKNVFWTSCKVPIIVVRFKWNMNFRDRFLKNTQVLNFMKIHPLGAELSNADGRTDMMNLIVTFRSVTNAPNNSMEPVQLCHFFDVNWVITVTKLIKCIIKNY
jgi:hypothetical protein